MDESPVEFGIDDAVLSPGFQLATSPASVSFNENYVDQ